MNTIVFLLIIVISIHMIHCTKEFNKESKTFYNLSDAHNIFQDYIIKYNKNYANKQEYALRYKIFMNKLDKLNKLNKEQYLTVFGINQFTDRTHEEIFANCMDLNSGRVPSLRYVDYKPQGVTPKEVDYRKNSCVTDVKDQGDCDASYVFSAIGNIEGQQAMKHQKLISLSEQQGLDCDSLSDGCKEGWPDNTIAELIKQGGCMTERDYPYNAEKGKKCGTDPKKIVTKVTDGYIMNITDLEILKNALANIGPLSIAIETCPEFELYLCGIFDRPCRGKLNKAVVLVGYGSENGFDYWIIKNSWGDYWGEYGYIRVQIREDNICGLGQYVVTAVVD